MKLFLKTAGLLPISSLAVAALLSLGSNQATAQRALGIDVSSYQGGSINWSAVRSAGGAFAWAKATQGVSITDADFAVNENNGKSAGVFMGAYHYAQPNDNSPASEASHFWSVAGGYVLADGKTFMPMLDFEVFSGAVGASSYSDWANQWCSDVRADAAAGHVTIKPFLYTSACNGCEFNTSVAQWFDDIADYNGQNPENGTPWSTCTGCEVWGSGVWNVWQYSGGGSWSGVPTAVDLDVVNGGSVSSYVATGTTDLTNRKGMATTPDGGGYWIVASDGGVFSFGDAQFYGSMGGQHLNAPVVGMAARPQGNGYWLVGSDGGIFSFGDAGFRGSMGGTMLNQPVVGIAATGTSNGYWMVAADGGIFNFGDAIFYGSMGGHPLNRAVVGMAALPSGNGYRVVAADGGIFTFGAAAFYGSTGSITLNKPMGGMEDTP